MAYLLIKAIDATHANAQKNAVGCYKRGDIVQVSDAPFTGRKELLPPAEGGKFVILTIEGVTANQLRRFAMKQWGHPLDAEDEDEALGQVRRRRFRIDVDLLPSGVRATLRDTGKFSTTWEAVRDRLRNKRNNQTAANAAIGADDANDDLGR